MTFTVRFPNIFLSDNKMFPRTREALERIATQYEVAPALLVSEEYLPGTTFIYLHGLVVAAIVEMVNQDASTTYNWVWDDRITQKFHLARLEAYSLGQNRQWYHAP